MTYRSRATDRRLITDTGSGAATERASLGLSAAIDSQGVLRAARSNCTLLLCGETGVGKGHLARWIHQHSPRAQGPFIPVNCGAIPEGLIDSQLFGHTRGSFSGATGDHLGLVRAALGGTLLLDEVSELPPSAQNRLLRLLADREVQPVGHARPVVVDVRVIAATNTDLEAATRDGRFRQDLLFRLDVIRLQVAPLRERLDEFPELLQRFNAEFAGLYGQPELQFDPATMDLLKACRWPGNIRQLRTLVERLHVLCPGELITSQKVLAIGQLTPSASNQPALVEIGRIKLEQVRRAVADSGGSISRAAEILGVHRSTIYRWLRGD